MIDLAAEKITAVNYISRLGMLSLAFSPVLVAIAVFLSN